MTIKRQKTLERLEGVGTVYESKNAIAKTRYSLVITQEVLIDRTPKGTAELEGLKSINGSITVIDGEDWLMDKQSLVLELEDGRRIGFFANDADIMSKRYRFVRTGGWPDNLYQ